MFLFAILFSLCGLGFAKVAPDFIRPCPKLTPECLKKTIQETIPQFVKGIPALGLNVTDPLYREYEKLELPGGLKVRFIDGVVNGLRNCIVDSAKFENDVTNIELRCNITIKGKYKANGRILIVTINGDGDATIKVSNIILNAQIKFEDSIRDGTVFYDVKEFKVQHRFGDKVTFALTNLFEGNQQISEAVLAFLNTNWKQIAEEFGSPIVDAIVNDVFNVIKKFFRVIPKNELLVQ